MSAEQKRLGPMLATFVVAGNMIGSGVFLLPAVLAETGSSSMLGWLIAAIGASLLAAVYAALGTIRPQQEGLIEYPSKAFHPAVGFVSWAAYWSSCWIGNVAVILAAVGYLASLFTEGFSRAAETAVLLAVIWGLALANLAGARQVGRFAGATLVIGLLPILLATAIGLASFNLDIFTASWNISSEPLMAAIPPTILTIFWAFLGLESANAIAPVVKDPKRNVAIAAVGGVLIAAAVYAIATAALFGVLPAEELARSSAPFADVVTSVAGPWIGAVVAVAAITRIVGCAGGWFLVSAQTARSGAESGYLPKALARDGSEDRPVRNILFVAILMTVVVFATLSSTLNDQFTLIVDFSVLLFMAVYTISALSLLKFSSTVESQRLRLLLRLTAITSVGFCLFVAVGSY